MNLPLFGQFSLEVEIEDFAKEKLAKNLSPSDFKILFKKGWFSSPKKPKKATVIPFKTTVGKKEDIL